MTTKENAAQAGEQGGKGNAESFISRNYSTHTDAALMMVSFALGYIAGCLL